MTPILKPAITHDKYQQFEQLYREFLAQYLATPAGERHTASYAQEASVAEQSYAQLQARHQAGESITDEVLLKLLPYTNNASNRWKGAWVHHAPVITSDLRGWFAAKGWAQAADWPTIAAAIWHFVQRCVETPQELEAACVEFAALPAGHGFQSGMLSPILSALKPESFTLINNKSRQTLNYFTDADFSQSLTDYPTANRALWQLIQAVTPLLTANSQQSTINNQQPTRHPPPATRHAQLFDLFSHWLVSLRKFNFRSSRAWHLALGEDIWQWEEWQEGGFVAIGWDDLGDLTKITRTEFDSRRESLLRQFKDWPKDGQQAGIGLAWKFARQMHEGDRVVVMLGDTLVLGIGSVTGDYYYVSEIPFGHRLPVCWDDLHPRQLAQPLKGAMFAPLEPILFEEIVNTAQTTTPLAELFATAQNASKQARTPPAFLRFVLPILESLRMSGGSARSAEMTAQVVEKVGIAASELAGVAANGANSVKSQIYRARRFLAQSGWIEAQPRGLWQLTEEGKTIQLTDESILARHQEMEYQRRLRTTYSHQSPPIKQLAESKPVYGMEGRGERGEERVTNEQQSTINSQQPTVNSQQSTINDPPPATRHGSAELAERPPPATPYSLADCAAATFLDESMLAQWVQAIERKGQAIFYGPPGVGKTFLAKHLARHLVAEGNRASGDDSFSGDDGFYEIVQFHPAYAYEDFVQGIRPLATAHGISYPVVAGRFLEFCANARQRAGRCVLIIDEMNRANLSRVFGELMHLLEYREETVRLAASGEPFSIPANVRILGTMNTADRSIALIDYALRRRFAFIALQPNYDLLRRFHTHHQTGFALEPLIDTLQRINQQIGDPHYALGVSFFLRQNLAEEIESIWRVEIEPYLEEYFFDRPEQVEGLRWGNLTR